MKSTIIIMALALFVWLPLLLFVPEYITTGAIDIDSTLKGMEGDWGLFVVLIVCLTVIAFNVNRLCELHNRYRG